LRHQKIPRFGDIRMPIDKWDNKPYEGQHVLDDPPPFPVKLGGYGARPCWSPDGKWIALVDGKWLAFVVNTYTNEQASARGSAS
jgi:hypothetical protein